MLHFIHNYHRYSFRSLTFEFYVRNIPFRNNRVQILSWERLLTYVGAENKGLLVGVSLDGLRVGSSLVGLSVGESEVGYREGLELG